LSFTEFFAENAKGLIRFSNYATDLTFAGVSINDKWFIKLRGREFWLFLGKGPCKNSPFPQNGVHFLRCGALHVEDPWDFIRLQFDSFSGYEKP